MTSIPNDLTLVGNLITLRSPTPKDEEVMLAIFLDSRTTEFLGPIIPEEGWNKDTVHDYFEIRKKDCEQGKAINLSIEDNKTKKMLGVAGCRHISLDEKRANLGVILNPEYWGSGVASEAGLLVAKYLFEDLGIEEIEFQMLEDNPRAAGICSSVGLKPVGIHNNKDIPGLENVNLLTFKIKKGDFLKIQDLLIKRINNQRV